MGIVSDPGGQGKGFVTGGQGGASQTQGRVRGRGKRHDPPEGRERPAGGTGPRPSARSGRGRDGQADRSERAHEVSGARTGRAPGPKTATTRRRPCRHTGHRVRSTPVNRCSRVATASGGPGGGAGGTARSWRQRASLAFRRRRFQRFPGEGPISRSPIILSSPFDSAAGEGDS